MGAKKIKKNYLTMQINTDLYKLFQSYCERRSQTMSGVLKAFIVEVLETENSKTK